MADILDNGGSTQEAQQINDTLIHGTGERLQQVAQLAYQFLHKGFEMAQQAFDNRLELGNKKLLPETTTEADLDAVEGAVQDPENSKVEVNGIAQNEQGEIVRQPVADPWDMDKTVGNLEPQESAAIKVDAVVVDPDPLPSQTQSKERPLVNEFIDKAGKNIKQGANNFAAQANAFIAENIQVEYQPIPQQDGTLALAVDKPSLLTQMSVAGGNFAQAAQDEMKKLAPQQFDRVSQAVKNTQEKVQGAINQVSNNVQERMNEPSVKERLGNVEVGLQNIQTEVNQALKAEISGLRSQVGNLEGQIASMQQQQAKTDQMIASLQAPKPKLSNPRLNQWQSKFTAQTKEKFQQVKQHLGNKIDQAKAKVGELVEGFKQKAGALLQPIVDRLKPVYKQAEDLKQQAGDQINQVKATVGEKVDHAKQFVGEKAMDWQAKALAATATYVLAQQGKQTLQGTTIYEGETFDFHRNQGNSLLIIDKATQQPVYKDGEFNQKAPQQVKDKLVKAAQTTQQGLEEKQAHKQKQAQKQTQNPKPKAVAAKR